QQQQQSSSDENSPLLPGSAELKLLRSSQKRVNQRTAAIDEARTAGDEPEAALLRSLENTVERQAQCAEMAREIRDRRNQP
ncbi:MAG: hypothetical protein IID36_11755, partial [Planctomycetes bacterium]|nr:hypothetical protein [Planctomycetota bacterium]